MHQRFDQFLPRPLLLVHQRFHELMAHEQSLNLLQLGLQTVEFVAWLLHGGPILRGGINLAAAPP